MKILLFGIIASLFIVLSKTKAKAQNNFPYPVIFVHGLVGGDETFQGSFEYLRDHDNLGGVNVYDVILNGDDDKESSVMSEDVKWNDFTYSGRFINVGRRNFAEDIDDFTDGWTGTNLFAINFKEERIRGAAGGMWSNDYFDWGDQSGIFKQGYALGKMINEVLEYTGAEKVILVGHSMGGLCIREYLQRTDAYGNHTNWIDPTNAYGHKVARVVTFGTPHLGSNTGTDPTKSLAPDEDSEAMRDMKWEFDSYTNCGGTPKGIYIFGGNEHCIASTWYNTTFENVDINCNGSENDDIVGVSEGTHANSSMPLPTNIRYTWITSIWASWGGNLVGDGAVNINRQWLHNSSSTPTPLNLADTLLTDVLHTSEGGEYATVIRGLDEPHEFNLAYTLPFDNTKIGYITYRSGWQTTDADMYKVNTLGKDIISVTIEESLSGVEKIYMYDKNQSLLSSTTVSSFPANLSVNVPSSSDKVYIKVEGNPTNTTWQHPYKITVTGNSSYCASRGRSVNDEWLQRVTIGSIDNNSGANAGYADFTNLSTELLKGVSTPITLQAAWSSTTYQEAYMVWIDFNHDGDFNDAGEMAYKHPSTSSSPVVGSVIVPSSALEGNTIMRVSMKYNDYASPCEVFNYGEVEDYTVNIVSASNDVQAPTMPTFLTAASITSNSLVLSWNASTDNFAVTGYNVYKNGVNIGSVSGTSALINSLSPSTTYSFYVKAKDAAGNISGASNTVNPTTLSATTSYCTSKGLNSSEEFINRVVFNDIDKTSGNNGGYADFTSISTTVGKGSQYTITIYPTWPGSEYEEGYAVWIDYNNDGDFDDANELVYSHTKTKLASVSGSFTIPTGAVTGSTRMRVSMQYNQIPVACDNFNYGEVEDYTINIVGGAIMPSSINKIEDSKTFSVYPNPATNEISLTISNSENNKVVINSITGAVVKELLLNENNNKINISDLPAGVYTVKMISENKIISTKFIKE